MEFLQAKIVEERYMKPSHFDQVLFGLYLGVGAALLLHPLGVAVVVGVVLLSFALFHGVKSILLSYKGE